MLRQRQMGTKKEEKKSSLDDVTEVKSKRQSGKSLFVFFARLIVVLYVIVPVAFYLYPSIRHHIVFLNYVNLYTSKNLSLPEEAGLNCTRNFYIQSDNIIQLGSWHIPAAEAMSRCKKGALKPGEEFSDTRPIFLYLPGNFGTRGLGHRVSLYNVLSQKVNAHVVAFDYRGYGDSTNTPPSQDGVVSDSLHAYYWLRKYVDAKRIYVWGHSLGSGIATAVFEKLLQDKEIPAGLILEAPFTKLVDAVTQNPLLVPYRHMPFFDFIFTNPLAAETNVFNSINKIGKVKSPVLILHAEDDGMVPYHQGKLLYEQSLTERSDHHRIQFACFDGKHGYGHAYICQDPDLPDIIKQFMENANSQVKKT